MRTRRATRGNFVSQGTFGNVWRPFWLSQLGVEAWGVVLRACPSRKQWVGASDTAKHPAVHRAAPYKQNCPAPNISTAEVEKPYFTWRWLCIHEEGGQEEWREGLAAPYSFLPIFNCWLVLQFNPSSITVSLKFLYMDPPLLTVVIIVLNKQTENPIKVVYVGNVKDKYFSWFIFSTCVCGRGYARKNRCE